ncbi:site-specific DNA-methyltransferase [Actinacidiphila oryziradicis]|uniref:site-specific DNA-methyltransferase (cytosine-N(4)-specific) n=1 Tax=Actinacidiphila oryziradicis TaxID=2571141 RepID=A0A4U0SX53_9ACTN|nr:site-specific DNA-methyltransferase [Actinacidiphila oryziradicis]TKA13301.1 site-specific DNA-methyltransferase [Actinacidiphila oryziradicis]
MTTPVILLFGDAVEALPQLPAGSADCVVTSPPYYRPCGYGHDDQDVVNEQGSV